MNIFVNYPQYWLDKYQTTDTRYLASLQLLRNFIPVETQCNKDLFSPFLLPFLARLKLTRFHSHLPTFLGRQTPVHTDSLKDFDLFLTHWFIPVFWGLSKRKTRTIISFHFCSDTYLSSLNPSFPREHVTRQYLDSILTYFVKHDALVMFTAKSCKRFQLEFPQFAAKAHHIPFFLPSVKSVSNEFVKNKMEDLQRVNLLFVGRDGKRKGIFQLLDAISNLEQQLRRQINLTIVTQATIQPELLPDVGSFRLNTQASHSEVLELMRETHLFCLPTLSDSYGIVFVEAMSNGCAILADNDEPRQEVVAENGAGICVNPNDASGLQKALQHFLGNKQFLYQCGMNSVKAFREKYSPEVVSQMYLELFNKLVD